MKILSEINQHRSIKGYLFWTAACGCATFIAIQDACNENKLYWIVVPIVAIAFLFNLGGLIIKLKNIQIYDNGAKKKINRRRQRRFSSFL